MKKISIEKLSKIVKEKRNDLNMTQSKLSKKTNMNRTMLSKLENKEYMPSVEQLEKLGEVLGFEYDDLYKENESKTVLKETAVKPCKIAVAGTGYVGLSLAVLLSLHNEVRAIDIVKEKVDLRGCGHNLGLLTTC